MIYRPEGPYIDIYTDIQATVNGTATAETKWLTQTSVFQVHELHGLHLPEMKK
jgi:hypothetical protein